jgi:mevalonate kinase
VILFGEHAINRGQPAISASVGLYACCHVRVLGKQQYRFQSGKQEQLCSREEIAALASRVEEYRAAKDYESIKGLAAKDYFAPSKYILASAFKEALPDGLEARWESQIPSCSGLGSGGAAFTALVAAFSPLLRQPPSLEERSTWAHWGDVIAHGGVASALDTQTSLLGGVIRYQGQGLAEKIAWAPGLTLIIGNTGVSAATSEVNSRVRLWLAERPGSRMRYFETVGALSRAAIPLLRLGEWEELGRLFTLNQLVLEKIGVSSSAIDQLIEVALSAGAYGGKLSGSGGGGIMIALVSPERRQRVAEAIAAAGGSVLTPDIAVPGVSLVS